jgi:AraC family transcriptional regulator, regulatory protein of adaptative response / DNA-3-methyladenine glycosylase II
MPDPSDDNLQRDRPDAAAGPSDGAHRYPAALERAMALIDARVAKAEGCDLAAIAAAVYTSPRHLSRLFQREMGLTFSRYCNAVRMRKARDLMVEQPFLTLTRVALASGFGSLRAFEEQFRQLYGVAPRQYREDVRAWQRRDGRGGLVMRPAWGMSEIRGFVSETRGFMSEIRVYCGG